MGTRKKELKPEVIEGFFYDEKNHLYFYDGKPMTGCTTILNVIAKPALIGWAARMATDYTKDELNLSPNDDGVGSYCPLNSAEIESVFENAQKAHAQKRDKAADEGTQLHALVEEYVKDCIHRNSGFPLQVPQDSPIEKFVQWALKEAVRFIASEQKLYSKKLFVAGTADLIFEKDGKMYIGDIKCKDKIWSREPFLQCAGYALMWEEMHGKGDSEKGSRPIDGYCVIRLKGGEIETLWSFDTEGDTRGFKAAVELYRCMANFKA